LGDILPKSKSCLSVCPNPGLASLLYPIFPYFHIYFFFFFFSEFEKKEKEEIFGRRMEEGYRRGARAGLDRQTDTFEILGDFLPFLKT
jgi:hypothetical protein